MCEKCEKLKTELENLELDLLSEEMLMDKSDCESFEETSLTIDFISNRIMFMSISLVMCEVNHEED